MRQLRFVGGAILAAVLAVIVWHEVPDNPPPIPAPSISVPMPPEAAAIPDSSGGVSPRIADRHDIDPPETNKVPLLPNRTVEPRPVHVVPENDPLPPPRPIDVRNPPGAAGQTVASGTTPPSVPSPPTRAPAVQIAGTAEASGAAALTVSGTPVRLFGVRPPSTVDRCAPAGATGAAALPCTEQAHRALAARLAHNAGVSCRVPAPNAAGAVCLDAEGVDLGGLLVAEGLALADPTQSYDYVGAELIARTQHRGLWLFR